MQDHINVFAPDYSIVRLNSIWIAFGIVILTLYYRAIAIPFKKTTTEKT